MSNHTCNLRYHRRGLELHQLNPVTRSRISSLRSATSQDSVPDIQRLSSKVGFPTGSLPPTPKHATFTLYPFKKVFSCKGYLTTVVLYGPYSLRNLAKYPLKNTSLLVAYADCQHFTHSSEKLSLWPIPESRAVAPDEVHYYVLTEEFFADITPTIYPELLI